MDEARRPAIAVMGAGAVGCYFGGMLARAGAAVTLIGREHHVEAINKDGLLLESLTFRERVSVSATVDLAGVRRASLVLFCVKTVGTERTANAIAPHVAPETIVLSLQNGVDNVQRIRSAGMVAAVPAVVYVAAEMVGPGHIRHTGRGDLIVGNIANDDAISRGRLEQMAALFAAAGVPCRLSENIEADLWTKLIMNCAFNAVSALTRSRYGVVANDPWTRGVVQQAIEESIAVAAAAGIRGMPSDLVDAGWKLAAAMPDATSSTAQDLARGKRTEIDSLNGYVARRGSELGIATPVNQTLHALVKLLEEAALKQL